MSLSTKELGAFGEQLAAEYLVDQGFVILARNWRSNSGELDIVALTEHTLVFCEVKTRRSTSRGFPAEAVTPAKLTHLRAAALNWLCEHKVSHHSMRFDVIAILATDLTSPKIHHIVDIGQ
ncbi:MAG: YraN family protein [Actinobacteria bacterium]|nr:YraN family protein [Actinomycetota bacterium]NBY15649.1 YraN family protein [Actinomycetota bacterium]